MTRYLLTVIPAWMLVSVIACGSVGADDIGGGGGEVVVGTECMSSSQCDDGIPCTLDRCNRGWCSNTEIVCQDDDFCTTDSCVNGVCVYDRTPGCCATDADCDDGNPCTKGDRCSQDSHTCIIATPLDPCCRSDAECDDGDVCTTDTCQVNLMCSNKWEISSFSKGICCSVPADCHDNDACTIDRCVISDASTTPQHGRCAHDVRCCDRDADCPDGDSPCTEGICSFEANPSSGECVKEPIAGCCLTVDDCEPMDCMSASCAGLECSYSRIPGCCTADAECGDPACLFCNKGSNSTGACELKGDSSCCKPTVLSEGFESSHGFVFEPMNMAGYADSPSWHVSSRLAATGSSALFFGDETTGYCRVDGQKTGGRAVTPSIPLMQTKNPVLQFKMWKDTDDIIKSNDVVSVYVISASGEQQVLSTSAMAVFNSPDQFTAFPSTPLSLSSWAGQSISIAFEYDSNSSMFVPYQGIYIDDIVISGTCN